jgi:hypothetical protein
MLMWGDELAPNDVVSGDPRAVLARSTLKDMFAPNRALGYRSPARMGVSSKKVTALPNWGQSAPSLLREEHKS